MKSAIIIRCPLAAFILLSAAVLHAQATREYDFPGTYKKRSAQGMAIHKDTAFLLNDQGHCRIYDLKTKTMTAEYDLASAAPNNHVNCASFGVEYPKDNAKYPAFYISECRAPYRCFVESVDENGSRLIQTLQLKTSGFDEKIADWFVYPAQKCLYVITHASKVTDDKGTKSHIISKLPLPSLREENVTFGKKDILDQFEVTFTNLLQGGAIRGGFLYLPVGLHDTPKHMERKDRDRAVVVVDLKTKRIVRTVNVNASVPHEPEDADFYNDTLLMYCGQKGGLFKIPLD
jgi:hypothetical protein